ncbi:helix-turn-helix transcriptional regulator [Mesorhizobium sp. B2-8-1]|nr:helix-turn-helix transcriptional regulator [Mesorhizobium sp. B2-8-1]
MICMKQRLALLSAISEPLRLRALALISAHGEACVCQLTHALQTSQPSVSKHLAVLREAGVVAQRRDAQWMLYRIADLPDWAQTVVNGALDGIELEPEHQNDLNRMAGAPDGPSPSNRRPRHHRQLPVLAGERG